MIDSTRTVQDFNTQGITRSSFKYPSDDTLNQLNAVVAKILWQEDYAFLLDSVITVIRELVLNAFKANAKRVYFKRNNANITNPEDYKRLMPIFRRDVINNYESILPDLNLHDYRIIMELKKTPDGILVTIVNNIDILPGEKERIEERLSVARETESFTDAYDRLFDDDEGAGLGLLLTVLLLRNAGFPVDRFIITFHHGFVRSSFLIPSRLRDKTLKSIISEKVNNEIEALPTFPESITELQRLCQEPDISIEEVAHHVEQDPAIASDVLKLANSGGFITGKRIETIHEAIMIIGLNTLSSLLMATGARSILEKRYNRFERIWSHCLKTGRYARRLAEIFHRPELPNRVFLGGVLHDIGQIVLLSIDLKTVNVISELVKNRKIRISTIIEEIAVGMSHSTIGGLIAEKWKFPPYLIQAIRHHHTPLQAETGSMEVVYIVYLANMFQGVEANRYQYTFFEAEVLTYFDIIGTEGLEQLHRQLKRDEDR